MVLTEMKRKGKERKRKERKGKERKRNETKGREEQRTDYPTYLGVEAGLWWYCKWVEFAVVRNWMVRA